MVPKIKLRKKQKKTAFIIEDSLKIQKKNKSLKLTVTSLKVTALVHFEL